MGSHGKNYGKVLIVDDDKDILDLLEYNLAREGFSVCTLNTGRKAVETANNFEPDLIILDIMMPHPNGIELCRDFRDNPKYQDTYIFFLTAKAESYYRQAVWSTGGDDFIEKVVGLRSLTYKVNSVLKRHFVIRKSVQELHVGNFYLNRSALKVNVGDREIPLSKAEADLLFFFAQNPGKKISRENLFYNVWGSEVFLYDATVDNHIERLAGKIGHNLIRREGEDHYYFTNGKDPL